MAGILILAGALAWRFPSRAQPSVELSFVRYEYDAMVLRLANRTGMRLVVISANAPNVTFTSFVRHVEPHDELELQTTRAKLTPSSLPSKIDVQCMPLPSRRRQQAAALLKKIGINIAVTNFVVSVNLPPLDPIPMRP